MNFPMKNYFFSSLVLGSLLQVNSARASQPPRCEVESECVANVGDCVATSLQWGPESYYALTRPHYESRYIQAESTLSYTLQTNMVCVASNGVVSRYSTTKHLSSDILAKGGYVELDRTYTSRSENGFATDIWSLPAEYITQAQELAVQACQNRRPTFVQTLQNSPGLCPQN